MGRRGPAPKPSNLRLIEGTDKRGRSGKKLDLSKEPVAPDGEIAPPYDMDDDVRDIWDQTVADLETMGIASPADANVLAAYCEAVATHRTASRLLRQSSILVKGDRTLVINKALLVQERAAAQLLRLAQEFGLTPSARTRVEVGSYGIKRPASQPTSKKPNPFAGAS